MFYTPTWRKMGLMNTLQISSIIVTIMPSVSGATDSSLPRNNTTRRGKWTRRRAPQMALFTCRGTVPLTIPLLKVSLSQLTASSAGVRVHTHKHTRMCTRAHLKTLQLMGLNLINCSETDTLSLINPFLRHSAHGKKMVTIRHKHTLGHTNTHIFMGRGTERLREGEREGLGYIHSHGKTWSFARAIQL